MEPSEAAQLLAKMSAFDRRTVGESDALAWAEALSDTVTLSEGMAAVTEHFRASHDWLMPDRLIELVKKARKERLAAAGYPDMPGGLDWRQERDWRVHWQALVAQGCAAWEAQALADAYFGIKRPPDVAGDVDELAARHNWPKSVNS